jgi:hypothetical protein
MKGLMQWEKEKRQENESLVLGKNSVWRVSHMRSFIAWFIDT